MPAPIHRRWQLWAAVLLVAGIVAAALLAPVLAPPVDRADPQMMKRTGSAQDPVPHPPSPGSPLGTTPHQFDVFYTLVWGSRQALGFGLSVTLLSALIGTLAGAVCAYQGGFLNRLFLGITNAMLAFPLMAAIPFMVLLFDFLLMKVSPGDPTAQVPAAVSLLYHLFERVGAFTPAVLLLYWIPYARLVNDQVLRLKDTEFISAAKAVGAKNRRIILRHLIPNSIAPVIIWATKNVGALVILQATFTYIGLEDGSAWAALLREGRHWIIGPGGDLLAHWWVYLPVTLAIILFGFAWNLLGDEVNTAINPRERFS